MPRPVPSRLLVLLLVSALALGGCAGRVSAPTPPEEPAPTPAPGEVAYGVATSGAALVACVSIGMVRSTDGGKSWTHVHAQGAYHLVTLGSAIFGVTADAVLYSTDTGETWRPTQPASGLPSNPTTRARMLAVGGGMVFAIGTYPGVYRTTDLGATWQPMSAGLPAGQQIWTIAAREDAVLVGTHDGRLFRSTDAGESWTEIGSAPGSGYYTLGATLNRFYAARFSREIYASADLGDTWTLAGEPLPESAPPRWLVGDGATMFALTADGVFRRFDSGGAWKRLPIGTPTDRDVYDMTPVSSTLYAATENLGVQVSDDYGATWKRLAATGGGPAPIITVDEP